MDKTCDQAGRQDGATTADDTLKTASGGEVNRQPQETDGFQLVIDALKLNGIDTIFGLPGIPITDLTRKLQAAGMRVISFRHEQNAGYAASIAGFMTRQAGHLPHGVRPRLPERTDGARQRHHQLLSDDPHQRLERARDRRPAAGRLRGDGPARHREAARQGRVPRAARRGHRRGRRAGDPCCALRPSRRRLSRPAGQAVPADDRRGSREEVADQGRRSGAAPDPGAGRRASARSIS